jgi:hypothetical protein
MNRFTGLIRRGHRASEPDGSLCSISTRLVGSILGREVATCFVRRRLSGTLRLSWRYPLFCSVNFRIADGPDTIVNAAASPEPAVPLGDAKESIGARIIVPSSRVLPGRKLKNRIELRTA